MLGWMSDRNDLMPRKPFQPQVGSPSVSSERALELLRRQVEAAKPLLSDSQLTEAQSKDWLVTTEDCVVRAFGKNTDHYYEFVSVSPPAGMTYYYHEPSREEQLRHRKDFLRYKMEALTSLSKVLELDIELKTEGRSPAVQDVQPGDNSIFIVHGHDHAALHSVARFIEHLGLTPTILHEQPNRGQTLIEKFQANSKVGFAVVLLTADDVGRSVKAGSSDEKPRARQNVILELGYFLGAIGRLRVCPLCVPGVEMPSDYFGVAYTPLDEGGAWKLTLARELKAAQFAVDLNKAM